MAGKKSRGRKKMELKKITNEDDLLVTFSKRGSGIFKKANELATMHGAEVAVVIFSPSGEPFSYAHPSDDHVVNRFLNRAPPENNNVDHTMHSRVEELRQMHESMAKLCVDIRSHLDGRMMRDSAAPSTSSSSQA